MELSAKIQQKWVRDPEPIRKTEYDCAKEQKKYSYCDRCLQQPQQKLRPQRTPFSLAFCLLCTNSRVDDRSSFIKR